VVNEICVGLIKVLQGYVGAQWQEQDGFLWIGTKNGLNRYDSEHFEVFTNYPDDPFTIFKDDPENAESLTGSFIISVFEDDENHNVNIKEGATTRSLDNVGVFQNVVICQNKSHTCKNKSQTCRMPRQVGDLFSHFT